MNTEWLSLIAVAAFLAACVLAGLPTLRDARRDDEANEVEDEERYVGRHRTDAVPLPELTFDRSAGGVR